MRFKLDENLPPIAAVRLSVAGHDACTVHNQHMQGAPDQDLATICHAENRAVVTLDRGFADIRRHPPGDFSGIVVLRPSNQLWGSIRVVVDHFIEALSQSENTPQLTLKGRLWVVEAGRVRVRGGQ